jgi:hypothetical protein
MSAVWSRVVYSCLGLALTGCGGSDNDGAGAGDGQQLSQGTIQSFEGTYELTAFTQNAAGCDSEGASTLDSKLERSFVMVGAEAFGTRYMALASCAGAADCEAVVSAIRTLGVYAPEYSLTLSTEAGADELGGLLAMSGFLDGGMCTKREYTAHTLTREGATIRVESRLIPLADAPPEEGVCWAEPAKQRAEAEERPCTELRVISGRRLAPLP